MKLFIEKHPDLVRLIDLFNEMEMRAHRLGVQIDELYRDKEIQSNSLRASFRRRSGAISDYRQDVLKRFERSHSINIDSGSTDLRRNYRKDPV
jgi:hypothetical protein